MNFHKYVLIFSVTYNTHYNHILRDRLVSALNVGHHQAITQEHKNVCSVYSKADVLRTSVHSVLQIHCDMVV
jgi:hypothetical protein